MIGDVEKPNERVCCTQQLNLAYTIDDDGVWSECDRCGFRKNLGFHGTTQDVNIAQTEHDNR